MNERRKTFRTIVKMAKDKKIPAAAGLNKVNVNNITYTHRNLDCLPPGLTLEDAKVVKVKGGLAFHSNHAWPSNFYPAPIEVEGMKFLTVEHAYQYAKATRNNDTIAASLIVRAKKPQEAKKLGAGVELSTAWDRDKIDIMRHLTSEKYHQHPVLLEKLVGSGQLNLIEATLDGFWGAKAVLSSKSIKNGTWTGANMFGKILIETRDELRRELGLPAEPVEPMEVSNAPTGADTEAATDTHPPAGETGDQVSSNQERKQTAPFPIFKLRKSNQSQNPDSSQTKTPVQNQQRSGPTPSRKNKNHQSPVISNDGSPVTSSAITKKQRIFSPKTSLPPKNFSALGSIFSCPPVNEDPSVISSNASLLAHNRPEEYLSCIVSFLLLLFHFLGREIVEIFIMLTVVLTDSRGRYLDTLLDDENILVSFYSGATLAFIAEQALEVISRHRPDMIIIMAGINDLTILNRTTRRVRLISNNSRAMIDQLIESINLAKSRIISVFPEVHVAIGGIIGLELNKYNHRHGVSSHQWIIDDTITAINAYINQVNQDSGLPNLRLTSKVHTWRKGLRKNLYSRLHDGLHPGDVVLNSWANQLRIFHYKCENLWSHKKN